MKHLLYLTLVVVVIFTLFQCKKSSDPVTPGNTTPPVSGTSVTGTSTAPQVNTATAPTTSGIASTSATASAVISGNGGAAISQHGFVYSKTSQTPTTADSKTELGATTGPFPLTITSKLTGLEANTTYNVRAYATNDKGTGYGAVAQVKTSAGAVVPSSGNFLYYGTADKGIVALDAANGTVVWQNTSVGRVRQRINPFIYGDNVFFSANTNSGGDKIYAMDTKTGAIKWELAAGKLFPAYSNVVLENGVIYATTGDAMVYAIDAASGKQKWSYKAGGEIQMPPSVDKSVVVLYSYQDGLLVALDKNSGVLKWKRRGLGSIGAHETAVVDGNLFAAAALDSGFVCFDALTGKPKWAFENKRLGYYAPPTVQNGVAYLALLFDFMALDVSTGKIKWKFTSPTGTFYPSTSFAGGNGFIYAVGGDKLLYGLDATNGTKKWTYSKVDIDSSPTLAGDVVYALGEKTGSAPNDNIKEIYALDAKTGALKTTISTGSNYPNTRITALINGKPYYAGYMSIYQ